MASAYALAIFSGKIIFISRLSRPAGTCRGKASICSRRPLRRLKAPLGLSLLRNRGLLQTHFHKRGRRGKQHLQSESAILPLRPLP